MAWFRDTRSARFWIVIVAAGILFGALDRVVDLWTSVGADVANRSSIWLVAAFLAGAIARSPVAAAVAGAAFLLAALAGFYGWMHVVEDTADAAYLSSVAAKWAYGALVAGPLLGLLGSAWRRGWRWAPAVAGGLLVAESVVWVLPSRVEAGRVIVSVGEAAVGAAIVFLAVSSRTGAA